MSQKAELEELRSLAFGSISGTYAAVGSQFVNRCRIICFTNNTDGDMLFTRYTDKDEIFIPAGSFKLFDITTNARTTNRDDLVFAIGTRWYVKQSTAPTEGAVYLETIYASET